MNRYKRWQCIKCCFLYFHALFLSIRYSVKMQDVISRHAWQSAVANQYGVSHPLVNIALAYPIRPSNVYISKGERIKRNVNKLDNLSYGVTYQNVHRGWLWVEERKKEQYGMIRDFAVISVTNDRSLHTMVNRKLYYTATIAVWPTPTCCNQLTWA